MDQPITMYDVLEALEKSGLRLTKIVNNEFNAGISGTLALAMALNEARLGEIVRTEAIERASKDG
jgi:hypothetical protein